MTEGDRKKNDEMWANYRQWKEMTPAERRIRWEYLVNQSDRKAWAQTERGRIALTIGGHLDYGYLHDLVAVTGEMFSDDNGGQVHRSVVFVKKGSPDGYFTVAAKAIALLLEAGNVLRVVGEEPWRDGPCCPACGGSGELRQTKG